MKHLLLPLLFLILTSCEQYTTPVYDDPLYNQTSENAKPLGKGAEVYSQRGDRIQDNHPYTLHEGETYQEYTARLINTLAAQEYELDTLNAAIDKKAVNLDTLKIQIKELEERHMRLRLSYMRITANEGGADGDLEALFNRYVVLENDTLQKIAFKKYKTHSAWLSIYRFNREQLPHGPNRITPGQVLFLPISHSQQEL